MIFLPNELKCNALSNVPKQKLIMCVGLFVYMVVSLCYPTKVQFVLMFYHSH